ncbi:MAG: DUF4383 domain-containing protein [Ktedonobacterales bacterium]
MLDLTHPLDVLTPDTTATIEGASETVDTFELTERQPDDTLLLRMPIARGFAFLAGGMLVTLGVAGFLPVVTAGGTLLGFFQVDPVSNIVHLLTGLAGLAAWQSRRESLAIAFGSSMVLIYIVLFSLGNIAFGNAEGSTVAHGIILLNLLPLRDLPAFMANGFHVSLAMAALLAMMAEGLREGARASARRGRRLIREYHSTTRIRSAA